MRNRNALYGLILVALVFAYFYGFHAADQTTLEQARLDHLDTFDPLSAARNLKAPERLPSGQATLGTSRDDYKTRLLAFADAYLSNSSQRAALVADVEALLRGNYTNDLPTTLWSTSPLGTASDTFSLWEKLLPDTPKPFTGSVWSIKVLDDQGIAQKVSEWAGKEWSVWNKLDFGVLRADVFRYMSMLWEGGIYADTDTGVGHRSPR